MVAILLAWLAVTTPTVAATPGSEWAIAMLPGGHEFTLEIAADDETRARGYSGRRTIADDEGMLFLFDTSGHHSFWMKDCFVALDIIWLDERWNVVEIAERLEPCPSEGRCPGHAPMRRARYVLEVVGGTVERVGLRPGQWIEMLGEPPFP